MIVFLGPQMNQIIIFMSQFSLVYFFSLQAQRFFLGLYTSCLNYLTCQSSSFHPEWEDCLLHLIVNFAQFFKELYPIYGFLLF